MPPLGGRIALRPAILIPTLAALSLLACRPPEQAHLPGQLPPECSTPQLKPVCDAVLAMDLAFRNRDAAEASSAFTDDAEWMNPSGLHLHGRQEIQAFLTQRYSAPPSAGTPDPPLQIQSARLYKPVLAMVYSYVEIPGLKSSRTGKLAPARRIHEVQVLHQVDGKWLIVSQAILDDGD